LLDVVKRDSTDCSAPRFAIAMNENKFTAAELEGYLDEALPADLSGQIEQAARDDPALAQRLATIIDRRDSGVHSLGEIWRRWRISCPTRQDLGGYLLGVLTTEMARFVECHIEAVGCRYCQANLADLTAQHEASDQQTDNRRQRYFQSSAGLLKAKR
jgi:hypothetical protein